MIAADQASAAEEKIMTKAMGFVSALIFALGTAPAARAQVMLDVSKITCEQFAGYKNHPAKYRDLAERLL